MGDLLRKLGGEFEIVSYRLIPVFNCSFPGDSIE